MGNFNLKKFLVENKLTANSRMVNEYEAPETLVDLVDEFLENSGISNEHQIENLLELQEYIQQKIDDLEGDEDFDDDNYDEYNDDDRFGNLSENAEISKEDFIRGLAAELKQQGFANVSQILNDKTGMGSFDQGTWYPNTSDSMLDGELIEDVEPIIYDYCDEKGVEVVS